jgi:hypothetical protein
MNLRKRLAGLFVDPKREWSAIAGEPSDVAWLYRHFIVIVAAVPAVALFLRFTLGAAPLSGFRAAASSYLAALLGVLAAAFVIEKLAPRFHSRGSTAQALKLVAYSTAPAWLAGALYLLPGLVGTARIIGGLYGIYLFALGLPRILHTPREQIVPFMVVCALALVAINVVVNALFAGSRWL